MQFNVVSRETLLDAQKHPEQYKHLVVRVAGYSALFTTLSSHCRMTSSAEQSRDFRIQAERCATWKIT